jgi:hypothetical protein
MSKAIANKWKPKVGDEVSFILPDKTKRGRGFVRTLMTATTFEVEAVDGNWYLVDTTTDQLVHVLERLIQ